MQKVLITGSSGFIGSALMNRLRLKNFELVGLDINRSSTTTIVSDILSDELEGILKREKPQIVVHLAAQIDVRDSIKNPKRDLLLNGIGTLNLVTKALENDCSNFIYINSGGAIYDQTSKLPVSEFSPELPASPYGLSKLLAEGYVRIYCELMNSNWTSLALSNCYGPTNIHKKGVIHELSKALLEGSVPEIFGAENTRDFVYIDDVLDAIELTLKNPVNRRINISSGTQLSILNLYNLIAKELGSNQLPSIQESKIGEVVFSELSNDLARELIGWKPKVLIQDGISKSLSWVK